MDRKIYMIALIGVASCLGAIVIWASTPSISLGVKQGDAAIDFTVLDSTDKRISLSNLKGKTVIIDFMTSNCPACLEQIKQLKLVKQGESVVILSILLDQQSTGVELAELAKTHSITWILGWGPQAGATYKVNVVPTVLVVDPNGVIRYRGTYTTAATLESIIAGIR
jgi:peroxiredoxin